jgi:hypothetical protein
MKNNKFSKKIEEAIIEEEKEAKRQEHLKEKYSIDEDKIIVEKNNMFKFMVRTLGRIIRVLAEIIFFFLSVVGLAALIFPETRAFLHGELIELYKQIMQLIS